MQPPPDDEDILSDEPTLEEELVLDTLRPFKDACTPEEFEELVMTALAMLASSEGLQGLLDDLRSKDVQGSGIDSALGDEKKSGGAGG